MSPFREAVPRRNRSSHSTTKRRQSNAAVRVDPSWTTSGSSCSSQRSLESIHLKAFQCHDEAAQLYTRAGQSRVSKEGQRSSYRAGRFPEGSATISQQHAASCTLSVETRLPAKIVPARKPFPRTRAAKAISPPDSPIGRGPRFA